MDVRDLSPQEVEHCTETAGWPELIDSQTYAVDDITAHLFPATTKHEHTHPHTHTCDPPEPPQAKKENYAKF